MQIRELTPVQNIPSYSFEDISSDKFQNHPRNKKCLEKSGLDYWFNRDPEGIYHTGMPSQQQINTYFNCLNKSILTQDNNAIVSKRSKKKESNNDLLILAAILIAGGFILHKLKI